MIILKEGNTLLMFPEILKDIAQVKKQVGLLEEEIDNREVRIRLHFPQGFELEIFPGKVLCKVTKRSKRYGNFNLKKLFAGINKQKEALFSPI